MARRRIQRTFLWMAVVLAAVLIAVLVALVALGIPRNAAGMAAKGVCSAAFLAGRPWNTLIADDVLPASPALLPISVSVDTAAQSVTARFAGMFPREARMVADRGCVLDLPAAMPGPARKAPPVDPHLPWPQGDGAVPVALWGPGVDAAALQKLAQDTFVGASDPQRANARAMAIVHQGRLLMLRTAPGFESSTPLHGWSMTKTVAGMLEYKLAIESGLPFETPVVDAFGKQRGEPAWVAEWRGDARRSIKVSDLFYMRDGLANTEDYDPWGSVPRMLWGHADAPAFGAAAKAEAPAGTRWRYLSQTANLLAAVNRSRLASDADYWSYPAKALFDPIGATTAILESDTTGNWVASSYLWASVGDWARLGQLMLSDGRWGTQQVVPPGWLAFAMTPSTPQGEGRGYGAHTWRIGDPEHGECKGHGLPADTIGMSGHWGQLLAMVPSRQAVIVRLGWTFRRKQFDGCAFVAEALRALPP